MRATTVHKQSIHTCVQGCNTPMQSFQSLRAYYIQLYPVVIGYTKICVICSSLYIVGYNHIDKHTFTHIYLLHYAKLHRVAMHCITCCYMTNHSATWRLCDATLHSGSIHACSTLTTCITYIYIAYIASIAHITYITYMKNMTYNASSTDIKYITHTRSHFSTIDYITWN